MDVISAALKRGSVASEKVAVTLGDKYFTYAELLHSADRISSLLKVHDTIKGHAIQDDEFRREGVQERDLRRGLDGPCIGIVAKPCPEFVAAVLGAWLNRWIVVPLAPSFPEAELNHVITDAEISLVLTPDEVNCEIVERSVGKRSAKSLILPRVYAGTQVSQNLDKLLLNFQNQISAIAAESAALIIYTSGTTGRPKGVVHTHSSLGAQVQLISEAWACTSRDRFLHCLPLHHVHGLINALLTPLFVGARVDFLPKFSTSGVWQCWRTNFRNDGQDLESPITLFTGVPTMYVRLLQGYANMDPQLQKASAEAAKQLRVMLCASSALPEPVMDEWESITGHRLVERYGMTEFGMGISNPLYGEKKAGFVGKPLPRTEIKVDDSESDVKGIGELLFKSPSMFREYWRKPQATTDSFTKDGYFKTGDTVTMDEDGYIKILGRSSVDILMVGGFKVSALEIEAVLLEHPAIAECAVFGAPDTDYGEVAFAAIVPHEVEDAAVAEGVLDIQVLRQWAHERLAPYKIPKKLITLQTIPRNAMGKVNKKELRKSLLESTK